MTCVKTYGKKTILLVAHLTSLLNAPLTLNRETLRNETKAFAPSLHDFNEHANDLRISHFDIVVSLSRLGTQAYILNGTDPEGDPVRYGLTFEKGSKEYFRVDSKSGNVTLIQELDREVSL